MPVNDELGCRMKDFYETIPKTRLMRRTPVAIRLDGRSFHTFTKGFKKPFDEVLIKTMQQTTKYLCENIQGCVLGYTQSDEITLILIDYQKLETNAWFNYEVQKMCSIAASMATMAFNKYFNENINVENFEFTDEVLPDGEFNPNYKNKEMEELWLTHIKAIEKGAMFDARCFNIPKEEVTNLVYWRQLDAIRNSIQMVGQANFSHKELHCKTCNNIKEMLIEQKNIDWNKFPSYKKWGSCVVRNKLTIKTDGESIKTILRDTSKSKNEWIIDKEIPVFRDEDREYIEQLIYVGE